MFHSHTLLSHQFSLTWHLLPSFYSSPLTHSEVVSSTLPLTLSHHHLLLYFHGPWTCWLDWSTNCIHLPLGSGTRTHTHTHTHTHTQITASHALPAAATSSVSHAVFASLISQKVFIHTITHSGILNLRHPSGLTAIFSHTINLSHIRSHYFSWSNSLAWTVSHTTHLLNTESPAYL